ncbi:MAG: type II secretion system F family protein [Abditibacteriales bacterium]|nr:type II secretion system F family protein [Abditibacteriales bacterium]MDW8367122.1 type II secretion system F family protein [Abditibacteriales bacterium]
MVIIIVVAIVWLIAIVMLFVGLKGESMERMFRRRLERELQRLDENLAIIREQESEELRRPLVQRLLMPPLEKFGKVFSRNASALVGTQAQELLMQAGYPGGMTLVHFTGLKLLCFLLTLGIAGITSPLMLRFVNGKLLEFAPALAPYADYMKYLLVPYFILMADIGMLLPTFWLRRVISKRRAQIKKSMADTVDLIVLGLEAGLGFDAAVRQAVEKLKGPLTDELARVMAEVNSGKAQADAFRDMAERLKMEELSLLVAAIDQAIKMGTGLAHALRLQATDLRERRIAWAKEQAAKLPVKMLFPLIFFIFPALFIVILGPAGIQAIEVFQQQGGLFGQ